MTWSAKVLVFGDDGSAAADVAWLWINNHRWPGWTARVVSVHLPPLGPAPDPESAALHPWEPPVSRRPWPQAHLAEVAYLTAEADPRVVLGEQADASLLVIGPRGRGMLKALHIGSTAEWLLQSPPAPMIVVRSARPTGQVLACVDGSEHAARAVQALAGMPWIAGCQVTVLGVVDGHTDPKSAVEAAAETLSDQGAHALPRIEGLKRRSSPGHVRHVILEAVEELEPDLVTVGTRGLLGLKRLRLGSTASAVAQTVPCSVLIARTGSGSQEDPSHL